MQQKGKKNTARELPQYDGKQFHIVWFFLKKKIVHFVNPFTLKSLTIRRKKRGINS